MAAYRAEKKAVPSLPFQDDYLEMFKKRIGHIMNNGTGVTAIQGNRLVGFLAGYEIEEFFSRCSGVYIPVCGHGAEAEHKQLIYQKLYQAAADIWVKRGLMSQAITLFAHDQEGIKTWFWLGFGLRCVDSIREVVPAAAASTACANKNNTMLKEFKIKKVDKEDLTSLAAMHRRHNLYYRTSPIFMPNGEVDPLRDLGEWLKMENHHLWAAFSGVIPLGYIRIEPDGESFVSEQDSLMNISSAYIEENWRGSGIGTLLLDTVQQWLQENDYPLLGVDFESINIAGSSFWNKYFTPYTYSLVRRIDERISDLT